MRGTRPVAGLLMAAGVWVLVGPGWALVAASVWLVVSPVAPADLSPWGRQVAGSLTASARRFTRAGRRAVAVTAMPIGLCALLAAAYLLGGLMLGLAALGVIAVALSLLTGWEPKSIPTVNLSRFRE